MSIASELPYKVKRVIIRDGVESIRVHEEKHLKDLIVRLSFTLVLSKIL